MAVGSGELHRLSLLLLRQSDAGQNLEAVEALL